MIVIENQETMERKTIEEGKMYLPPWKAIRILPKPKPSLDGKWGLGDLIAVLLMIIGIHKKKGCGCNKRQNEWNKYRIRVPDWITKLINRGLEWHL